MNMPVPTNAAPPPTPPIIVVINVDFDGTITWVTGNSSEVFQPGDRNSIEQRLAAVAAAADQPEVHLRPNKLVEYRYVAMVMATAQRLGVTKIGIVGNEQFL
jgi:biopolymer transport protein ExbD